MFRVIEFDFSTSMVKRQFASFIALSLREIHSRAGDRKRKCHMPCEVCNVRRIMGIGAG